MRSGVAPPGGWVLLARPRIAPRPAPGPRLAAWLIRRVAGIDAANLFLALMRHRRLFLPWLAFASRLVPYGTLERRDTELSVLRVAWNCRCRYEWGQHLDIALRAGLGPEEIARVPCGSDAPGWSPRQVALLDAVDEIHATRFISDSTWQRLGNYLKASQLIEFCMLVGQYEMIASLLDSLGLPLDDRIEQSMAAMAARRV